MGKQIERNRIPRSFERITGEMLIDTNVDKKGDMLHIFKDEMGYAALNLRTGKRARVFVDMLRNAALFKVAEIL